MLEGVAAGAREFPANMKEILATPKTLVLFLAGIVALLYTGTDALMRSFFWPPILAFGLLSYFVFLWHKQGYKLDLVRKLMLGIAVSSALGSSVYGYAVYYVYDIDLARFPSEMPVAASWSRAPYLDDSELQMNGLLRVEVRGWAYTNPDPASAPYPGALWLATVKTVFIPSQDLIGQQVTKLVENLKQDGLTIYKSSKTGGDEVIKSGHEARYIEYEALLGVAGTGAFYATAQGAKIRIRVEWWPCPEHGTAIIVVGAGQYGNTLTSSRIQNILIGRQPDNNATVLNINKLIYAMHCA